MKKLLSATALAVGLASATQAHADFDINTGNAALEVVIQTAVGPIFEDVSPTGGDATLVLRVTTLLTNAWFDATAYYHPTAVGVYLRLDPRPEVEPTTANLNTSLLYASYRVFNSLLPGRADLWSQMMEQAGLDPGNASTDPNTAIGIGNLAGNAVVMGRELDGMNQLGDEIAREFNPEPYADYTGYEPKNTAYELKNPSRWQPDIQRFGMGLYKIQKFVTPQYALVEPYSYDDPADFEVPAPVATLTKSHPQYKQQADEVLSASANLTDEEKLMAELFDNKIASLGFSAVHAALSRNLSLMEFVHLDFLTNMAAFDAGIFIWRAKREFDAARPFSAIRWIYGDELVDAWGGPGVGRTFLPASEWKSYLEEADHPEYPSASACFCAAHTQSARLFLGDDELGFLVPHAPGSSRIEPGVTPQEETLLTFPTWTDFNDDCGQSRVWAGVHFQAAVDASRTLCNVFGEQAFDYLTELLNGTAPARPPSLGRPLDTLPGD